MVQWGRVLERPAPRLKLEAADRLEPSLHCMDIGEMEALPLLLPLVFWRRHLNARRITDKVLHRNPLLCVPLLDGVEVVMLDTLHTIYFGE